LSLTISSTKENTMSDNKTEKLFTKALTAARKGKGRNVVFGSKIPSARSPNIAEYERNSETTIRRGHHLIGAGPARFGYAAVTAAGDKTWMGRTLSDVEAKIASKEEKRKTVFGSRIPTQAEYEANERRSAHIAEERVNKAPLDERKENAKDLSVALRDPRLMQERIEWLIIGNYGKGPQLMAEEVLKSPRTNKYAGLTMLIGVHEWRVPRVMTAAIWKKLSPSEKKALDAAIDRAIASAQSE